MANQKKAANGPGIAMPSIPLLAAGALFMLLLVACAFFTFQYFLLSGELSALAKRQTQTSTELAALQVDYSQLELRYRQATGELEEKSGELDSANLKISMLTFQLNQTGARLELAQKQLEESKTSLESQRQQVQQISSELLGLEKNISDSMAWFRENAAFPDDYGWKADIYLKRVLDDCIEGDELNLGCMSYLMENTAFAIHYRTDFSSSGKDDFLQSVAQTIDSGWGDCEDYSLIFKAALNSLKAAQPGLKVVGWESGGEGKFYIYPKESSITPDKSYWYVPNAHKKFLGDLDSLFSYVVCYRQTQSSGHCTVALSENGISSSSQAPSLLGARIFEPQIGRYLGDIGGSGSAYTLCDPSVCSERAGAVQIIISDLDLYKFEAGKWVGYSDYLGRVKAAQARLQQA